MMTKRKTRNSEENKRWKGKEQDVEYEDARKIKLVSVHAMAVQECTEAQHHSLTSALNRG
jgi:hypothetical protein